MFSFSSVKDGVFRVYTGPRDKNDFITFIEDKRWRNIDPVPDYKHPNSKQYVSIIQFFILLRKMWKELYRDSFVMLYPVKNKVILYTYSIDVYLKASCEGSIQKVHVTTHLFPFVPFNADRVPY